MAKIRGRKVRKQSFFVLECPSDLILLLDVLIRLQETEERQKKRSNSRPSHLSVLARELLQLFPCPWIKLLH